ncbi:hypothetical protein [Campylobacter troglodytis]|nr:hypothetical protein [Campylobacter troglodytis]
MDCHADFLSARNDYPPHPTGCKPCEAKTHPQERGTFGLNSPSAR